MSETALSCPASMEGATRRSRAFAVWWPLFFLETRRVLRSWRWRTLFALAMVLCYVFQRGQGFGEGSLVSFPGGSSGVWALGLLLAAGALVLGVELAGQAEFYRWRTIEDSKPAGGFGVLAARVLAVSCSVWLVGCAVVAFPFLPWYWEELPLPVPSVVFLVFVLMPLILTSAACGLLGRTIASTDGGGLAIGGVLAAIPAWYRLAESVPAEIFSQTSDHLGLLVPVEVLAIDAAAAGLPALGALGVAILGYRRVSAPTPLRSISPVRLAAFPTVYRLVGSLPRRFRLAGWRGTLWCAALLAVGLPSWISLGSLAWDRIENPRPWEMRPEWNRMKPPSETARVVLPPRIVERNVEIEFAKGTRLRSELSLLAAGERPQEFAALTFGPMASIVSMERLGDGDVESVPQSISPGFDVSVLRFDPPLDEELVRVVFEVRPSPRAWRFWARTRQPEYASFAGIPFWTGEGVRINYSTLDWGVTQQPAPFTAALPAVGDRQWVAGSVMSGTCGKKATLQADFPADLSGLFAADLREVRARHGNWEVAFLVFPRHEELAEALQLIHAPAFERLSRAFGPLAAPLVYVEVPGEPPSGWTGALPSRELNRLADLLPEYDDPREPTAVEFKRAFPPMNKAAVQHAVDSTFAGYEHAPLLHDAWVEYLNEFAFNRGWYGEFDKRRLDYVFVPWEWTEASKQYPFDVLPRDEGGFRGPVMNRSADLPPVPPRRMVAFHHMLRGELGDEDYREAIGILRRERQGKSLHLADWIAAVKGASGKDLTWFFEQWLVEGVIPCYRLRRADVVLQENEETGRLEYTTELVAANEGDGRMDVPIVIETEADRIEAYRVLGADETTTVTVRTRERPLVGEIDPYGWIVQMPRFDERAKRPLRPRLFLKQVREIDNEP